MQLQWFERKVMEVLSTDQMEYSHVINSQLRKKCETPLECDKLWEREIKSISFWIRNKQQGVGIFAVKRVVRKFFQWPVENVNK